MTKISGFLNSPPQPVGLGALQTAVVGLQSENSLHFSTEEFVVFRCANVLFSNEKAK
jgi:hypothetical protein